MKGLIFGILRYLLWIVMFQRVSQGICFLQLYIYFQLNFVGSCE